MNQANSHHSTRHQASYTKHSSKHHRDSDKHSHGKLNRSPTNYYEHIYNQKSHSHSRKSACDYNQSKSSDNLCVNCLATLRTTCDMSKVVYDSLPSRSPCKSYQSLSKSKYMNEHNNMNYNLIDIETAAQLARESRAHLKLRNSDRKEKLTLFVIMLVNIAFFVAFCFLGVIFLNYIKFP